ncbi:hypothetical protein Tco_1535992, partial [Tanacetum coccineum]
DKSAPEPNKSDEQKPPKEVDKPNKGGIRVDDEPAKGARENVIKNEEEEPAGVSSSHASRKNETKDLRFITQWACARCICKEKITKKEDIDEILKYPVT